jgi:hypothetical protein
MSRSRFERHGYLESELKKEEAENDDSWFQQYQKQRQREQSIGRSSAQPKKKKKGTTLGFKNIKIKDENSK